jgi:hypothetical protein
MAPHACRRSARRLVPPSVFLPTLKGEATILAEARHVNRLEGGEFQSCTTCPIHIGGSAVLASATKCPEARTRGFAAPAFAGCAFVEGARALVKARYRGCQAAPRYGTVSHGVGSARLRVEQLRTSLHRRVRPVLHLEPHRGRRVGIRLRLATTPSKSSRSAAAKRSRPRPSTANKRGSTVLVAGMTRSSARFRRVRGSPKPHARR